ncbi:MAG: ribosome small subunit-dependent GTPase A [Gaiellaceae bacterium]
MKVVLELEMLGWDDAWRAAFAPFQERDLAPGRVAIQHRGEYDVLKADGEARARITNRLRRGASPAELPAVGDWVALDVAGAIVGVLPRRTTLSRRAAHDEGSDDAREQVLAANLDLVFIVASLGEEPDVRLLERYVALALESRTRPVILLTKADLEADPGAVAAEVAGMDGEIPVHPVSARTGFGLDAVRGRLQPGLTGALLGPSGVGKSTLVNALVGQDELLATGAVRADGQGRHTTTRRQLVALPGGGLIIDNPGMREVHLWLAEDGLTEAFEDIAELAARCRFSDCRHETEPDCAVRAALAHGGLQPERWQRYRALQHELADLEARLTRRERSRARRARPDAGAR